MRMYKRKVEEPKGKKGTKKGNDVPSTMSGNSLRNEMSYEEQVYRQSLPIQDGRG